MDILLMSRYLAGRSLDGLDVLYLDELYVDGVRITGLVTGTSNVLPSTALTGIGLYVTSSSSNAGFFVGGIQANSISITQGITGATLNISGQITGTSISCSTIIATGAVTAGSFTTIGTVNSSAVITGSIETTTIQTENLNVTDELTATNLFVNGNTDLGDVTAGNVVVESINVTGDLIGTVIDLDYLDSTTIVGSTLTITGTITAGSVVSFGSVSASAFTTIGVVTSGSVATGNINCTMLTSTGTITGTTVTGTSFVLGTAGLTTTNGTNMVITGSTVFLRRVAGSTNSEFVNAQNDTYIRNQAGAIIWIVDKTGGTCVLSGTFTSNALITGTISSGAITSSSTITGTSLTTTGAVNSNSLATGAITATGINASATISALNLNVGLITTSDQVYTNFLKVRNVEFASNANDLLLTTPGSYIAIRPVAGSVNSELTNDLNSLAVKNITGGYALIVDKTNDTTTVPKLIVSNNSNATSFTVAPALFTGGVGISRDLHVGSNQLVGLNNPVDAGRAIYIANSSTGTDAYSLLILRNNTGSDAFLQLNGSNRSTDGGTNTLTMRNAAGSVRIQSSSFDSIIMNSSGVTTFSKTLASTSTSSAAVIANSIALNNTTNAVSATNGGSLTSAGGFGFAQDGYVGGNLNVTGSISASSLSLSSNSGNWTPTINSSATINYTTRVGNYYVLGDLVFINCIMNTDSVLELSPGQLFRVSGLPFTVSAVVVAVPIPVEMGGYPIPVSTDFVTGLIELGTTTIIFIATRDDLDATAMVLPTTAKNRYIRFSGWYRK